MCYFFPGLGLIVCLCFSCLFTCSGGVPADSVFKVQIRWLQSRGIAVADTADRTFWCNICTSVMCQREHAHNLCHVCNLYHIMGDHV